MVPVRARLFHTSGIASPSPRLAAGQEGKSRHISLCSSHLLHYRMHAAYESASCKLQWLEASYLRPDTVFPTYIRYRVRCR